MPLLKILPSLISQGSFTGSFSGTGSYARRALTASYVLGGAAGSSGTSGANGTSGSSGSSGANGTSGSSGNSGTSGSSGTSATAGSSGTSGVGSPGTSGTAGSSGTSGSSGSSGNSGTSGSSGGTGSSGTSGAGSPGSSGSSGTSTTPALSLGQTYIGNGSTTTYALSQSVANRDQILVNVDGVLQGRSGNYYTVSGTTLTLSSPPQNGSIIDIRYINGGSGIVTTGSLAKQTILYNVVSGSQNVITGLNLSGNKWNVNVIEEWDAKAIPGDQYYNSCSLLMHFNGTNGSTTFTDNSKNNLTVTSNNGAAISTAQSKFGGASVFFDGTDDYLSSVNNSAFNLSSGDFTVEFWFRTSTLSLPASHAVLVGQMSYTSAGWGIWQYSSTTVYVYIGTGFAIQTPSVFSSTSTWYHIALVKNGTGANSLKLYVDGVVQAQGNYTPTYASSYPLVIGGITTTTGWNNNFYSNGYIDELRITKGVARYTSNFTPPNSQFYNNQSTYQSLTKYIGTVGGLNDANVDYGVQKLSDSSLKVVKMTIPGNPSSGSLSASIDRVYVNVLDYSKVYVTSSYATRTLTASYSLKSGNSLRTGSLYPITASRAVSSSYLLGGSQILTENRTVAFSSSFTTAQMQSLIDAQPKNLGGKNLTFKFADGTYNLSTGLYFTSFSNGSIYINGNSSNNTVAFAKNVTISGSGNSPIFISTNSTYTEVNYLRLAVNTSAYAGSLTIENTNAVVNYCSLTNYPRSIVGGSGHGILAQGRAAIWIKTCYFNFLDAAIVSVYNSIINAQSNSQGSNASIAYLAYGGIIQVQNTGLTGVTTYSTGVGGLIVRPSGTTVGT